MAGRIPGWRLTLRAFCSGAFATLAAPASAGPDPIGAGGSDPTLDETFQRGQAVAVEPDVGVGFVIFPIPISNPTVGTGLGLGTGLIYRLDEKSEPSYTGVGGLLTSNRTWGAGALQYLSIDDDRYRLSLGLGYASVRYDFFGAGSGAGDRGRSIPIRQDGYFTNPWAEVRIVDDLYLGLQYRLIEARTEIDADDHGGSIARLLSGRQADFVSSGVGPILDWDTRDDPFWPYKGNLLHAQWLFASGELFSDFTYNKGFVSFSTFHEVFEEGILAARVAGCFAGGEVPAIDLCLFGAHNDLRGYETGRYRDENSLALQVEQRWKFADRWGLVGFVGIGGIRSDVDKARKSEPLASAGAGLRFQRLR